MQTALVILAAGMGSRMKSSKPKVLHEVAGLPLIGHAMRSGAALSPARTVVVTGHGAEAVEAVVAGLDPSAVCVRQTEQLGTGHAVDQARDALDGFEGQVIVLYGDTPFISPETLARMSDSDADVTVLGFETADPEKYGRLVVEGDALMRIVEAKDASPDELEIRLCNSGVISADCATLFNLLSNVGNDNASGEYYLTDVVGLATSSGMSAKVVTCLEEETMGINSRVQLAEAEAVFQRNARVTAMTNGVTLAEPATVYFSHDTAIAADAWVGPNVVFGPGVTVDAGAEIRAFCHLEGSHVGPDAQIGPFARLRPGADLAAKARIGNFVEIKNATIAEGAKVNHLSYVGDASVGEAANIGAGTITCNYDGVMKHRTEIGARSFVGSNTLLVAPVKMGDESMTASGTVVTKDVPDGALAIGRVEAQNKPGFARKLMQVLRAKKMKRDR
ncbi:bifunctional UDP-N-acetylglucosamine diphosphorylase/glucosamine-1-phosphate N-acetyltransferase GlmU [uncultured Litoreibacter sp.]|uniref:bifunctional UDP-N-acetylglucosamine diphosphorylase/glucosamine-1-phosphate N-acetyltransferase GlmU n=1 Tax=uncultured Litoreibacter sp. TaxID=1392394 RepID=UPI002618D721|nr:bifunctional UDP-N-acetylglucosamine diphosphorylase/glucosamine-1-phosphate N-acetyltransferase GlmU [uncultured Litoreibacter sp.]